MTATIAERVDPHSLADDVNRDGIRSTARRMGANHHALARILTTAGYTYHRGKAPGMTFAARGEWRHPDRAPHRPAPDDPQPTGRPDTGWLERAECAGDDTELWFSFDPAGIGAAKTICRSCPVRSDCLTYALTEDLRWGVWGGLDEHERACLTGRRRP